MIISKLNSTQDFGRAFVTLSRKNLGEHIANNIVKSFNNNLLKLTEQPNDSFIFNKYKEDTDFWMLAPFSKHAYYPLCEEYTKITHFPVNKISLPIKTDDGKEIHILDWAMATAAPFAKDNKIECIFAEKPSGSFGDIVAYNKKMMETGTEIKDTIVCLADNVFDVKPRELDKFMLDTIKNPKKVMGLVGVEQSPEEVTNKFVVLSVAQDKNSIKDDVFSLMGFVEKPKIKMAEKLALSNGNCVVNTGMFVIKKEAMKALMEEIEVNPDVIKKNDWELYDFRKACDWIKTKYGPDACDVKIVKGWNPLDSIPSLYSFFNKVKQGHFLSEFGKYGEMIKKSVAKRFNYDENTQKGEWLLSDKYNSLDEVPPPVKENTPYFPAKDITKDITGNEKFTLMKIF